MSEMREKNLDILVVNNVWFMNMQHERNIFQILENLKYAIIHAIIVIFAYQMQ